MEFAFVTFVNSHPTYVQLMKSTIRSVELFSKYPIIVYCVDFPELFMPFIASDKCILRRISIQSVCGKSIYYVKPFIILDAIKQGLTSGYYIEADDIVTPSCDFIVTYLSKVDTFPISPIHPDDVIISKHFMNNLGVTTKTQHYIHAHVLFKSSNLDFIEECIYTFLTITVLTELHFSPYFSFVKLPNLFIQFGLFYQVSFELCYINSLTIF